METFKTPIEQSNALIESQKSPFNVWTVSQQEGKKTPSAFFGNGSKRLVKMSANDYFKLVASQSGTTPEKLMEHRQKVQNEMSVDDMRKKMREGELFDTPWVRLMDSGEKGEVKPYWQEGLHRMLAAGQEYGMDTKFPVYLAYDNDPWIEMDSMNMDDFIKHYDDTRLKRYSKELERRREQQEFWDRVDKRMAAKQFDVLLEQVTPEMLKAYRKQEEQDLLEDLDDDL